MFDRFERGLPDPQEARIVGKCEQCKYEIFEGNEVIRYEDLMFCDTFCLQEHLLENTDYEEVVV